MKDIVVEFSGWVRISPHKVKFIKIGSDEDQIINGAEWQNLSEEDKSSFILEDLIKVQADAEDGEYISIEITQE